MTQLTKEETAVKDALYRFWFDHYTKPYTTAQRNQLVEDFAAKWLDPSKIKLDKPVFYHPMNSQKRRYDEPKYTAMDILADFIIRADMRAERRAEYPVTHAEQDITNADKRGENEIGLFSDEIDEELGERVPSGYISEEDVVSHLAHQSKRPPSVEDVRRELARVKEYPEYWAATLSEEYGYDEAEALKRINALKLERVKECRICGGGFYTHDMRRQVCDQQHGIGSDGRRSKRSACEIIDQQKYNADYYEKSVS
ncbi:hypothetical protein MHB50_11350 [Siminovitchia sp. FSL H7-0308]|uniref:hypothetical protein n=1 Tax=Siminovitchia sp. FSL H7-0308 TaxID=2921432 RepID=UPI0030ECA575